jgi:hypothetical protein
LRLRGPLLGLGLLSGHFARFARFGAAVLLELAEVGECAVEGAFELLDLL